MASPHVSNTPMNRCPSGLHASFLSVPQLTPITVSCQSDGLILQYCACSPGVTCNGSMLLCFSRNCCCHFNRSTCSQEAVNLLVSSSLFWWVRELLSVGDGAWGAVVCNVYKEWQVKMQKGFNLDCKLHSWQLLLLKRIWYHHNQSPGFRFLWQMRPQTRCH